MSKHPKHFFFNLLLISATYNRIALKAAFTKTAMTRSAQEVFNGLPISNTGNIRKLTSPCSRPAREGGARCVVRASPRHVMKRQG